MRSKATKGGSVLEELAGNMGQKRMRRGKALSDFEAELVSLGIAAASAFSLPKSVGAIFGLIFASAEPLALDDCVEQLEISKGSASQGLKFLQRMGAVKPVYRGRSLGDGRGVSRKTYYEPEISLRRLLIGILNENVMPHLKESGEQVGRLRELLDERPEAEQVILRERLDAIETWGKKGKLIFPVVERVLRAPMGKGQKGA